MLFVRLILRENYSRIRNTAKDASFVGRLAVYIGKIGFTISW